MSESGIRLLVPSKEDLSSKTEAPWLIEGLLPAGVVTELSGSPLAGKTSFAFHMARAIGEGKEFLGKKVKGGAKKVAWISVEDGWAEEMLQRGEKGWPWLDLVPDESTELFMVSDTSKEWADWWSSLAEQMKEGNYGLLVVDHLLGFTTSASTEGIDRPQAVGPFLTILGRLAKETGAAVVLLHHHNKSGKSMGSINIQARTRASISLTRQASGKVRAAVKSNRLSPYTIQFDFLRPLEYQLTEKNEEKAPAAKKKTDPAPKEEPEITYTTARVKRDMATAPAAAKKSQRAMSAWLKDKKKYTMSDRSLRRMIQDIGLPK